MAETNRPLLDRRSRPPRSDDGTARVSRGWIGNDARTMLFAATKAAPVAGVAGTMATRETRLADSGACDARLWRHAMKVVVLGLSITSSWGNGHATNYRGLVRELASRGHEVLFCERDIPLYENSRDLRELRGARSVPVWLRGRTGPGRRQRHRRGGSGHHRLARARGRRRRRVRPVDHPGPHGVLRHRDADDDRQARRRRSRVSDTGVDPAVRPVPLIHGRADLDDPRGRLPRPSRDRVLRTC